MARDPPEKFVLAGSLIQSPPTRYRASYRTRMRFAPPPPLAGRAIAHEGLRTPGDEGKGQVPSKIQSICNGKCDGITMQGLATARENPPAQEQWRAMEKTMR